MTEYGRPTGAWRKSSRSDDTQCVEVLLVPESGVALLRDSTDPAGPYLQFPFESWAGLLRDARGGGLDRGADHR